MSISNKHYELYCRCRLCRTEFTFNTAYKRQVVIVDDKNRQLPDFLESRIVCPKCYSHKYTIQSKPYAVENSLHLVFATCAQCPHRDLKARKYVCSLGIRSTAGYPTCAIYEHPEKWTDYVAVLAKQQLTPKEITPP